MHASTLALSRHVAVATLLVACTPAPAPSPEGAGAVEVPKASATARPSSSSAAPSSSAAEPSPLALAARLVDDRDVALYDPARKAVVYVDTWQQEGTGEGLRVDQLAGGKVTTLAEHDAGASTAELLETMTATVAKGLEGHRWTVLERKGWDDPSTPQKVQGVTATFAAPKLAVRSARGEAAVSITPPSASPHVPAPMALYVAEGVDVVVVAIWFDAGSSYGQGFNSYAEHRVLRLE